MALLTYKRCLVCVLVAMSCFMIIALVHIRSNTTSTISAVKQTPLQEDRPVTEQPPAAVLHVKLPSILASLRLSSSETVLITPEKLDQNKYINEEVYMSLLTTPKHHESHFAYQLLTWLQTFNPNQVRVITDKSDDKWIKAAQKMGFNVIFCGCPKTTWHNVADIRCKTGRQFEEFYKARDNGQKYSWYCHADDDVYFNAQSLSNELSKYDPHTEHVYLGQWRGLTKLFFGNVDRLKVENLAFFPEAKKKGVVYAQGSTYCVSAAIMYGGAEKYLRGKNFVDLCTKLNYYDDVCVGAVIEAILGNDLSENTKFQNEVIPLTPAMDADQLKKLVSFSYGTISHRKLNSRFKRQQDPSGYFSYHCIVYPIVPWCSSR